MASIRRGLKKTFEAITGYQVISVEPNMMVVANKEGVDGAWFSYDLQLRAILEKCDVNLVLDVGANRGQFVGTLRKAYKGRVLSFEPVAGICAELAKAASTDPDWDAYNLALGGRDGSETIHISGKSVFTSFLNTNEYCEQRFGSAAAAASEEVVHVRRLDTLLPELVPNLKTARIYLKMDTQGYDLEVFKGLGNLRERVVALQTEVSVIPIYEGMAPWTESIRVFESAGFGVAGLFPVNRESLRVIEYDCMMISA